MASLRELQRSFAAAVRDPASACAVAPPENLAVYRNNAASGFRTALQRTFPVVRRRVGDDYFRQLAAHYRERFPSRSGDLHWAGRDFAAFLDEYLAGSDYAWLADLARLEWSRHECSVFVESPPIGAGQLARFAAPELEHLVFGFQPSLRLHESSYPVFSVWQANQVENAPPVDQFTESECGMARIRNDLPDVRVLEPRLFSFLSALHGGASLGEAMGHAGFDKNALTHAMAFLFGEGLVTSISLRAAREVV
jgi:hypothetical protein